MKKIILVSLLFSITASSLTSEKISQKMPVLDVKQQSGVSKFIHLLRKPDAQSSGLIQVASNAWLACRQECRDEQSICLQNGFDRSSCRLWYLECLSENC